LRCDHQNLASDDKGNESPDKSIRLNGNIDFIYDTRSLQ